MAKKKKSRRSIFNLTETQKMRNSYYRALKTVGWISADPLHGVARSAQKQWWWKNYKTSMNNALAYLNFGQEDIVYVPGPRGGEAGGCYIKLPHPVPKPVAILLKVSGYHSRSTSRTASHEDVPLLRAAAHLLGCPYVVSVFSSIPEDYHARANRQRIKQVEEALDAGAKDKEDTF